MHIVSVINYKGGVGKTTLTANLASELAYRGNKVLMIDLDAQASLTFSFITPDDWKNNYAENKTIKNWFDSFEANSQMALSELIFTPRRATSALRGRGRLI
jgi:chromosome partitioning protein